MTIPMGTKAAFAALFNEALFDEEVEPVRDISARCMEFLAYRTSNQKQNLKAR